MGWAENEGAITLEEYEQKLAEVDQLIQDERKAAVEEYRQKLNAYWPEGSEEPRLSAKQIKQILDKVTNKED